MDEILKLAQLFERLAQAKSDEAEWIYHVDIFEPEGAGMGYPVVRHSFYGKSKKEAKGYFESHMKTDEFMRGCVKSGKWEKLKCKTKTKWEKA